MNTTHTSIKQIYKGGRGIDVLLDLHVWVECGGVEIDYDDNELKKASLYGTSDIIRVPFPNKLAAECLPLVMEVTSAKMEAATEMGVAGECFDIWMNNYGNCCSRSVMVYKTLKKEGYKPKLKIGSLGFVQANKKDVFYEYG